MRFLVVSVLLVLLGCGSRASEDVPPTAAVALPSELAQVLRAYEAAYARGDSTAMAALFAPDGFLLPLNRPLIRGGDAVAGALSREGGALTLVPVAYGLADSVAYIIGTFGAERSAAVGGKFVLALRRGASGEWRVAADIANPNGR
jgi:ketosteroid isomerase-like protein